MSQVDPDIARRSSRDLKKTQKQKQIDDEKAVKVKVAEDRAREKQSQSEAKQHRAEERVRVAALQTQAKAELQNAEATVRMMYDMSEIPGLDSNDPNYELIRKIAHCTGINYAGQGFTTEELQEILDDPIANATLDKSDTNGPTAHQPDFAQYYAGITFGGNLDPDPSPKSTPTSKPGRPALAETPTAKKRRTSPTSTSSHTANAAEHNSNGRKGSLVPPAATCRFSPVTRTDHTTFHGGTPTRPDRPPPPPRRKTTPLAPTDTTTIMGGTPQHPVQARSGLKILYGFSQPLPTPTQPPNPTSYIPNAKPPPAASNPQEPSSKGDSLPSHPRSPAPGASTPRNTGTLSSKEPTPITPPRVPPQAKGKGRAQSTSSVTERPSSHTEGHLASNQLSQLIAERERVADKLRKEYAIWKAYRQDAVEGQPLPPDMVAVLRQVKELRERYTTLIEQTSNAPGKSNPGGSNPMGDVSKASHTRNSPTSKAGPSTSVPRVSPGSRTKKRPRKHSNSDDDEDDEDHHYGNRKSDDDGDSDQGGDGNGNGNNNSNGGGSNGNSNGDSSNNGANGGDNEDDLGDGQGPDDRSDGEPDNFRGRTQRSEREMQNKPQLSDFPRADGHILARARSFALAGLLSRGIFKYLPTDAGPKLNHEHYVYKNAWRSACLDLGVDRPYRAIYGKWMGQRRSAFIYDSAKLLEPLVNDHFGFTSDNPQRNLSIHKDVSARGCHKEANGRAFQSPLVRQGVRALVFDPGHPHGILCPDLFSPIPTRVIAFVCAIIQFIVNNYRKGPWNKDRMSAPTQGTFFRQFLKEYEKEEGTTKNTEAWGKDYRTRMYTRGRLLYEAGKPIMDPMPKAEGTWSSDMEIESD